MSEIKNQLACGPIDADESIIMRAHALAKEAAMDFVKKVRRGNNFHNLLQYGIAGNFDEMLSDLLHIECSRAGENRLAASLVNLIQSDTPEAKIFRHTLSECYADEYYNNFRDEAERDMIAESEDARELAWGI